MTVKNFTMTFEHGLMRTWRLPLFSALLMLFRASARTFMRTILIGTYERTVLTLAMKNITIKNTYWGRHWSRKLCYIVAPIYIKDAFDGEGLREYLPDGVNVNRCEERPSLCFDGKEKQWIRSTGNRKGESLRSFYWLGMRSKRVFRTKKNTYWIT